MLFKIGFYFLGTIVTLSGNLIVSTSDLESISSKHLESHFAARKVATKTSKKACPKPKSNLIVVNFTTSSVQVYVNNRKIGAVPAQDQKKFKEVLAVGENLVVPTIKSSGVAIMQESFSIVNEGKATCKKNYPILLR